jgi:(p)ppGpp synthase/HD superfamily hydrolase
MERLISQALQVAARAHAQQTDKSGEPYILHPIRVAFDYHLDTVEEQVVALLHDTIEDTAVTYAEIYAQFGYLIAEGVASVSRGYINSATGEMVFKPTEGYEKEVYVNFIERAKRHPVGRFVKIADLQDNLSPIRMNHLPASERGMHKRYERALKILSGE